ncbi:hypothetical protein F0562_027987 [Nyssa sinensis]|uniref:Uncharacterized protein n=1 Tax=Nyssa sinensis TaxID=561372 RepID=A0A5J5B9N1_9ASTE|nr:hypothetical protein F0562_027987 [Nyssa sinensis]
MDLITSDSSSASGPPPPSSSASASSATWSPPTVLGKPTYISLLEAIPISCNLLQYKDSQLVGNTAAYLIKIAERVHHPFDILDQPSSLLSTESDHLMNPQKNAHNSLEVGATAILVGDTEAKLKGQPWKNYGTAGHSSHETYSNPAISAKQNFQNYQSWETSGLCSQ